MATLTLSNTLVDFDSLRQQLEQHLATRDAWKGFHITQSGQTIIDLIAAVGTLNGVKLMRYAQDTHPSTALSNEAIYNIAVAQGVRVNRCLPMEINATLISASGSVLVPKFTQFNVGGVKFFNREAFTVHEATVGGTGNNNVYTLFQGEIVRKVAKGLGSDYQVYCCAEKDFVISDVDVEVRLNGETIERKLEDGVWTLKGRKGYRDRTLPDGSTILEFGNEQYGARPGVNDDVEILYAVTEGLKASTVKTQTKKVKCEQFPSITGVATTNPANGGDQKPIELYKNVSATSFGNFGAAVTRNQYINTMMSYPGVIDATIFAQRDINPNAPFWMNLMTMVVLTSTPWTGQTRADFVNYVQDRSMYAVRLAVDHPNPVAVAVAATIYCSPWSDLTRCKQDAEVAVRKLFAPRPGIIGYDIFLSDLYKTLKDANPGIEYVKIISPTRDLHVANTPMEAPRAALAVATGHLTTGEYHWSVSPVINAGEIAPRNYTSMFLTESNRAALLIWNQYPNATGYKVWGRRFNRLGLLATLPSSSISWIDDGTVPENTSGTSATLAQTTAALRYNALQAVTIFAEPSDRSSSLYLNR